METNFGWLYGLLFGLLILVFGIWIDSRSAGEDRKKIRHILMARKAKNISITYLPAVRDRDHRTFEVDYEDAQGVQHTRTCKVHRWDGSIYWEDKEQ